MKNTKEIYIIQITSRFILIIEGRKCEGSLTAVN